MKSYEQRMIEKNLIHVENILPEVEKRKHDFARLIRLSDIRELYRGLKMFRAHHAATNILVHTENIVRELENLEGVLKEARILLLQQQQAEHHEQQKTTR